MTGYSELGHMQQGRDIVPEDEEPSLWKRLKSYLRPPEVEPVRRAIGTALIGRVEDLWQEVTTMKEILHDLEEQGTAEQVRGKLTIILISIGHDYDCLQRAFI